jgi:transcriptional regulator with XRE-family HTH domain
MKQRNFIGRLVGRLRDQNDWSQDYFAERLQLAGWHSATRDTVAKIEGGLLRIDLKQIYFIAIALGLQPLDFLSKIDWRKAVDETTH